MNFLKIKNKKNKSIYNFLISKIDGTIFKYFGLEFFLDFLKINHGKNFYIESNKQIIAYISYISSSEEKNLKNLIIKFIVRKPFILLIILQNIKFFFKFHNPPKNYLQLIHLVIDHNNIKNSLVKKKIKQKINNLNYKICKFYNFKGIYAMYDRKNKYAAGYYKKENYILYDKNFFFNFIKKKIR